MSPTGMAMSLTLDCGMASLKTVNQGRAQFCEETKNSFETASRRIGLLLQPFSNDFCLPQFVVLRIVLFKTGGLFTELTGDLRNYFTNSPGELSHTYNVQQNKSLEHRASVNLLQPQTTINSRAIILHQNTYTTAQNKFKHNTQPAAIRLCQLHRSTSVGLSTSTVIPIKLGNPSCFCQPDQPNSATPTKQARKTILRSLQ